MQWIAKSSVLRHYFTILFRYQSIGERCSKAISTTASAKSNGEFVVQQVQVLFRHGERAPLAKERYPNDPHQVSVYEPGGLAQLTNQGKMTEYCIGKMLRERYDDFLGSVYHPSDIYAVSSNIDRTKMSLQLALAGLYYPPSSIQLWNPNLPWLAIPTHYVPEKVDILFRPHTAAKYIEILEKVKKTEEVRTKVSVHAELFKYLTQKTGMNISDTTSAYEIYNTLAAQKAMNLTLPDWCTDSILKKMEDVVILDYEIRSYTTELKRTNGGHLIKRFVDNMDLKKERTVTRKMYLYSGHEVNIAAFTRAHNISEPPIPSYGTAIIMEKLLDKQGKIFVRMLYWDGAAQKLNTYKLLEGYGDACPIEKYLELVKNVMPHPEEITCLWDNITKDELLHLFDEELNLN